MFLLLLLAGSGWAADPVSVALSLDRTQAAPEDSIQMEIRVSGARSTDSPPEVRGLDAFHVTQGGSSSRIEIINGAYRSGVDFTYYLTPKKTGTFQIGPAEIRVDGKIYRSDARVLRVRQPNENGNAQPRTVFLTASLSKETVYVEEQPTYTLRLYLRRQAGNISLQLPEPENLTFTQLSKPREFDGVHDGLQYRIIEIPYAVTPLKEGVYSIDSARMNMTVSEPGRRSGRSLFDDPFFGGSLLSTSRPLTVSSNALELQVKALPLENRPKLFSGLVGQFAMEAEADPLRLKAGESTTLTVTVEGRGNIHRIPDIRIPEIRDMKVYADEPVLTPETDASGIHGSKTMKWALVPEKEGDFTIPPLQVAYFDPEKKQYQILETTLPPLTVLPGKTIALESPAAPQPGASGPAAGKQDVREIGQDILPLHDAIAHLAPTESSNEATVWKRALPWIVLLLPIVLHGSFLAVFSIRKRAIRFAPAQKAKKAAARAVRNCRAEGVCSGDLLLVFRDYLNERMGLERAAITADDAASLLQARGVSPKTISGVGALMKKLESAVYGGKDGDQESLAAEMAACIQQLEGEIK